MRVWLFAPAVVLALVVACSDDSAANKTPSESAFLTTEDCNARCLAKAAECAAPPAQAQVLCAERLCGQPLSRTQAECIYTKTCGELLTAASNRGNLATICPDGDAGASLETPPFVPAAMTIVGAIPRGYLVTRTRAEPLVSSLFNVTTRASFEPAPPAGFLPLVSDSRADVTVLSPPRNGCEAEVNVTLTATELAVSTSAVDTLPATTCTTFIDAIAAQGITLQLDDVPWRNSFERSTVTIVLRKP